MESPSADIQCHGGHKTVVRKKGTVLIDQIEPVGNFAIRIIFSDNYSSGIYNWELVHNFGHNHDKHIQEYYKSL